MTCAQMLRNIKAVNLRDEAGVIVDRNLAEIKELNIQQLMAGKNNKGEFLSPKHSESPFFKKPGAGLRYAAWKQKLFPETPFDVPNLIIIGTYHDSISFSRSSNTVTAQASASFAASIDRTFNNTPLGLNPESLNKAYTNIIRSPLIHTLAGKIGCGVRG